MPEEQVLDAPVDTDAEPIAVAPAKRMRLKIIAIIVGALVVLGAAFGGGVLLGSHLDTGGPTRGQFGNGGTGGFGGAPGTGQGGTGQGGTGQGGTGQGGTAGGGSGA